MLEIEDYTGDYFFLESEDLEEYNDIMEQMNEEEESYAYDIFTLEQTRSIIERILKNALSEDREGVLATAAQNVSLSLDKFLDIYSEHMNRG